MTRQYLLAAAVLAVAATGAAAAADPESPAGAPPAAAQGSEMQVDAYRGPRAIDLKQPVYPLSRRGSGREGWVQLHFMVDRSGRPYEIAVTDSIGDPAFEESAIRAIERSTFEPAAVNGEPVNAAHSILVSFALSGEDRGARRSFIRDYRRLTRAIEEGDRQEADARFDDLEARNLYEDAFLNLARHSYAARWGTPQQQLVALKRAIAHEGDERYLPDDAFLWALRSLFALQAEIQDFGGLLETWETLRGEDLDDQARQSLEQAVAEIEKLRVDDRAYAVSARIADERGSWHFKLLKKRFRIDRVSGNVAELKLRCDRDYVLFPYDPDMDYRITDGYGNCHLEVVGEPGTSFRLVQF